MRTTDVRKLLPESLGFLCPVHTPDGTPCGLMNHASYLCERVTEKDSSQKVVDFLNDFGMVQPASTDLQGANYYFVMLDGQLKGWLQEDVAKHVCEMLRVKKAMGIDGFSSTLEICLIEFTGKSTQYPGLYLFTDTARLVRPVLNLQTGTVEMIGSFEQVYLNICVIEDEAHELTTHQELTEHSILSAVASLTPFSDHNQSPRNMYQCQMGKQTMGTPCQAIQYRADNKLYRLQTPQSCLVRPYMYDEYKMDEYPSGTNAVVAVISYTGYDMEDAMVINKGSLERGFGWGSIYKTETIDLWGESGDKTVSLTFGGGPKAEVPSTLGADGLPAVGQRLEEGDDLYCYYNHSSGQMRVKRYEGKETAYVDSVRALSNNAGNAPFRKVSIVLRVPRNPIIGDKFASRHGQKGVCSQMWPVESMPFTEGGMVPDIIFNPHGFPSRMTIGMMIESMAGKSAAMHGDCYDATPFCFGEDNPAIDYFGEVLQKAGYNYYGNETLYSGVSGEELEAEIFIGVVYYQRLRHMVSDKFQVRTVGPNDPLTQQPVHGRKKGGGVRFGEMERDALLAHGCSALLHERLFISSDRSKAYVCEKCGSILSAVLEKKLNKKQWKCRSCDTAEHMVLVEIPFVFRYLVNELAAMNIKTTISLSR